MSERDDWLAVCKVKARNMIDSSNIPYQEDQATVSPIVIIDDNIDALDLKTNEYEEI